MVSSNTELEILVDELLVVLDKDIVQIELTLERLDSLRSAVIRRDEDGLRQLLEKIQAEGTEYTVVEARREEIRRRLAIILGCDFEQMNLSALCSVLEGDRQWEVSSRREILTELTSKLRMEHSCTMILLRECSRLNKTMLKGMFGRGDESVTYTSRGNAQWEIQNEMVNMRL